MGILELLEQLGKGANDFTQAGQAALPYQPEVPFVSKAPPPPANLAPGEMLPSHVPTRVQTPPVDAPRTSANAPPVPTTIPVAPVPPPPPQNPISGPPGASDDGVTFSGVSVKTDVPKAGNVLEPQPSAPGKQGVFPEDPGETLTKLYGNVLREAKERNANDVARQIEGGRRANQDVVFASMMQPGVAPTAMMLEANKPYNHPLETETYRKSMEAAQQGQKAQVGQMELDPNSEYAAQVRQSIMSSPEYDMEAQRRAAQTGEDPKAVRERMDKKLAESPPIVMKEIAARVGVSTEYIGKRATARETEAKGTYVDTSAADKMLDVIEKASALPQAMDPESQLSHTFQELYALSTNQPVSKLRGISASSFLHTDFAKQPIIQRILEQQVANINVARGVGVGTQPTPGVSPQMGGVQTNLGEIKTVSPAQAKKLETVAGETASLSQVRNAAQRIIALERKASTMRRAIDASTGGDAWLQYQQAFRDLAAGAEAIGDDELKAQVRQLVATNPSLSKEGGSGSVTATVLQNQKKAVLTILNKAQQRYQGYYGELDMPQGLKTEAIKPKMKIPPATFRTYRTMPNDDNLYHVFATDKGKEVWGRQVGPNDEFQITPPKG